MAITTQDQLIAALGSSSTYRRHWWYPGVAGRAFGWVSYWTSSGSPGGGAAATGTPTNPTSSTTGALGLQNAGSGNSQYLATISAALSTTSSPYTATVMIYDRLFHLGGLSGTIGTAQTVDATPSAPVNRGPGTTTGSITWPGNIGDGVEIWLECYTALGATPQTVTASYTNNLGSSGKTTTAVNVPISMLAQTAIVLPLAAGDTGVRSVQNITLSGSTGTAGNFGITLVRRVAEIPCAADAVGATMDPYQLGMPQIYDGACLALMVLQGTSTSAADPRVGLTFCQG